MAIVVVAKSRRFKAPTSFENMFGASKDWNDRPQGLVIGLIAASTNLGTGFWPHHAYLFESIPWSTVNGFPWNYQSKIAIFFNPWIDGGVCDVHSCMYIWMWIANKIIQFHVQSMRKLGSCPIGSEVRGFLHSQTLSRLMQKRGGYRYIGSPPVLAMTWRFCTPLSKVKAK